MALKATVRERLVSLFRSVRRTTAEAASGQHELAQLHPARGSQGQLLRADYLTAAQGMLDGVMRLGGVGVDHPDLRGAPINGIVQGDVSFDAIKAARRQGRAP